MTTQQQEVMTLIRQVCGLSEIAMSDTLESHNVDSLDVFELLLLLEEKYDIDIEDKNALEWVLVSDVVATVAALTDNPVKLFIGAYVKFENGQYAGQIFQQPNGQFTLGNQFITWDEDGKTATISTSNGFTVVEVFAEKPDHEGTYYGVPKGYQGSETDAIKLNLSQEYGTITNDEPKAINRIERADVDLFANAVQHPQDNGMNLIDLYAEIASQSAIYPGQNTPFGLMYVALGLAEAGEVQNKIKKIFRDDHVVEFETSDIPFSEAMTVKFNPVTDARRDQIKKELGGLAWYFVVTCKELGIKPSDVLLSNLEELCGRTERNTLSGSGDDR